MFLTALLPAGEQPEFADDVVEFSPWVIEHRVERATAPARDDSFAAALRATAVVNRSDLAGRSVATLAETLRRAPGVVLLESFGGFESPRLLIRGSGLDSSPTSRGVASLWPAIPPPPRSSSPAMAAASPSASNGPAESSLSLQNV